MTSPNGYDEPVSLTDTSIAFPENTTYRENANPKKGPTLTKLIFSVYVVGRTEPIAGKVVYLPENVTTDTVARTIRHVIANKANFVRHHLDRMSLEIDNVTAISYEYKASPVAVKLLNNHFGDSTKHFFSDVFK